MIGALGLLAAGVVIGNHTLIIAPLVYIISRFGRDIYLIAFSAFCIALGYTLELRTIYDLNSLVISTAIVLSAILMLDEGLTNRGPGRDEFILSAAVLTGAVIKSVLLPAIVLATVLNFRRVHSWRGAAAATISLSIVAVGFVVLRNYLGLPGTTSTQVAILGATAVLTVIPVWLMSRNEGIGWTVFELRKRG